MLEFDYTPDHVPTTTPAAPSPPEMALPAGIASPSTATPAAQKFQSCRWRRPAENGQAECCSHRDVLPLTGVNGFDPEAWCTECGFYKLRRTPKKREYPIR
jgi:hypothetical protein